MCGSGWRIATKKVTATPQPTGLLLHRQLAAAASFAAAPGAGNQRCSAPPTATGSLRSSGSATLASVSGGCLSPELVSLQAQVTVLHGFPDDRCTPNHLVEGPVSLAQNRLSQLSFFKEPHCVIALRAGVISSSDALRG
jgi:hypothetical protein